MSEAWPGNYWHRLRMQRPHRPAVVKASAQSQGCVETRDGFAAISKTPCRLPEACRGPTESSTATDKTRVARKEFARANNQSLAHRCAQSVSGLKYCHHRERVGPTPHHSRCPRRAELD